MSGGTGEEPGRRFLIATATPHYPRHPDWDRPGLVDACAQVVELFTGRLGYERVDDVGLGLTKDELTGRLRTFCKRGDLTPDDMLVVYIGTHGELLGGEHVLYTVDTDPADPDDALTTAELAKKIVQGSSIRIRRVLMLIDTCYSQRGGSDLVAQAAGRTATAWAHDLGSAFGVITSAKATQEALTGAFPTLLRAAFDGLTASGYRGPAYRPDDVVDAMNDSALRPGHQAVTLNWVGISRAMPPFFPVLGRAATVDVLDTATFRTIAGAYLRWAANEWRHIALGDLGVEGDVPDTQRLRRLPLRTMYISLQADLRTGEDRVRAEELRHLDAAEIEPGTSWRERFPRGVDDGTRPGVGSGSSDPGAVSLEEAFERHRLMVVLGDPGSGKTVLCRWLGSELALEGRNVLLGTTDGVVRIPLLFRVADHAAHNARRFAAGEDAEDLATFLAASLSEAALTELRYERATLRAMFATALATGNAVLLVDGLDELVHHRHEAVRAVVAMVREHVLSVAGPAQAVITSRVAGYDEVHLTTDGTAHYLIRPLTDRQVDRFVTQFFTVLQAVDQIAPFSARVGSGTSAVQRLARTPLHLTSMCSYWHRHRTLPATRAGLFRQLLLDTAYRWRSFPQSTDPELDGVLGDEDAFLSLLARIALWMHDNEDGRIHGDTLVELLDETLFGASRLTGDGTGTTALRLVDRIREKVGVLAEFSAGEFGFVHQTFREYLVGRSLLDGEVALPDRVAEVIDDPRWREPILLALGESTPEQRHAVLERGAGTDDPERWLQVFLAAQLEAPPEMQYVREVAEVMALAARTYEVLRVAGEPFDALDAAVAEVRAHVGRHGFDGVTMAVLDDPAAVGPLAALYLRREWLSSFVVSTLLVRVEEDPPEWDWPVQRALRRAAGPAPRRTISVVDELCVPRDDGTDESRLARRTLELGRGAWERERRRIDEVDVEPLVLPLARVLTDDAVRWARCRSDDAVMRVLVTLFGGLDHQDVLRWTREYDDFARLLSKPEAPRAAEIERRAAELVPRFPADQLVHGIAVHLDTTGYPAKPRTPVLDPAWMTRPSTPAVTAAVQEWLDGAAGDADALGRALRALAAGSDEDADRAEAELGVLAFDGTPTSGGAAIARTLARAVESVADAVVRGCLVVHDRLWSTANDLDDRTRAAAHLAVLRLLHDCGAWPHVVTLGGERAGHPLRQATSLAELLAGRWLEHPPELDVEDSVAISAWFAVLPGQQGGSGTCRDPLVVQLRALDPWQDHPLVAPLEALADDGPAADRGLDLVGRFGLDFLIDAVGDAVPAEVRLAVRIGARLLDELRRIDPTALPGARRGPGRSASFTLLDARHAQELLDAVPDAAAPTLATVSRMTADAAEVLAAGLARGPSDARWVSCARHALRLHDLETGPWDEGTGAALVELVGRASAVVAGRAHLVLLGPRRDAERHEREHRVSARGVGAWWGMATALGEESRPLPRILLTAALSEWDVDDPYAVLDALKRAADEPNGRRTWLRMLAASALWRPHCQLVLARWVAGVDDPEAARAALTATAVQLGSGHAVVPELVAAVTGAVQRVGVPARYLPGAVDRPWSINVTAPVVEACVAALEAGLTGEAAAADARRRLDAATLPVGDDPEDLTAYGAMAFKPLGARPDVVAPFVPEKVDVGALTGLLLAWLPALEARRDRVDLAEVPVTEAVLNLLVVLTRADPLPFRVGAEPAVVQPLLGAHALHGSSLAAMAALSLLGALRHVDLEPPDGPGLVDLVETALLRGPLVAEAALDFVRAVRHVRGGSTARALLDRIAGTPNESVAQGLAGLAVAHSRSPTCPSADHREIRSALHATLRSDGDRPAVHLEGVGSANDPVVLALGPDRRTEVRRLFRR